MIDLNDQKCLINVVTDITDRKRMEEALALSEKKWSTVFRSSPVWISIYDARRQEGDRCKRGVHDHHRAMSGMRSSAAHSSKKGCIPTPTARKKYVEILKKDGGFRDLEEEFRIKDGTIKSRCGRAEVVDLNGEKLLVSVILDITDRKRAEKKFRDLAELLPGGIFELDLQGRRYLREPERTGYVRLHPG